MKKQLFITTVIIVTTLLLILSGPSGLLAQEGRGKGRIAGTVKDEEGKPIKDAKITLQILTGVSSGAQRALGDTLSTAYEVTGKTTTEVEQGFKLETQSDKTGKWGIFGFASGQFKFTAEKEGYTPLEQMVRLSQVRKNPLMHIVLKKVPEVKIKTTTGVDQVAAEGFKKGNALYKEGKYSEALPYFESFLKKNPGQFKMGINLGNCYMQLKKYEEAVKTFKMVVEGFKKETSSLKGNEKAATIYASIGEAYGALNNFDEAAVYYKKSMELFPPRDAAVAYNIAEIMFNGGKTDEAIEYYGLAAKLKPEMAIYYQKLGYAYLNKGDFPQAAANFEKFIKLAPDDPQTPTLQSLVEDLKKQ